MSQPAGRPHPGFFGGCRQVGWALSGKIFALFPEIP
jgi:hypothetical protein